MYDLVRRNGAIECMKSIAKPPDLIIEVGYKIMSLNHRFALDRFHSTQRRGGREGGW